LTLNVGRGIIFVHTCMNVGVQQPGSLFLCPSIFVNPFLVSLYSLSSKPQAK